MNGPPHFQRCTNKILYTAGLRADAGYFINYLGSGGAHYTDSASCLDDLLLDCKTGNIKAGADKLELG